MTIKLIGAGLGRTGTHSLKEALQILLGGTCHHMMEVFGHPEEIPTWRDAARGAMPDWHSFLGGYTAIVDWPGATFYAQLAEAFPEAVVLLSTRPAADWYRSADNTIFNAFRSGDHAIGNNDWLEMATAVCIEPMDASIDDPEAMMAAFDRHNAEVRATIPSDRLLEWTARDGWQPICDALQLPVPAEPFPVTNSTADFRAMMGLPPV